MKYLKFILVGIFFGIVLVKSEAVSWYRIYEMFRFESFKMYGIIGSAVVTGIILLTIAKKFKLKNIEGTLMKAPLKNREFISPVLGGILFGLGWALCGACPGPMYILVGTGVFSMLIVIFAATIGAFIYGCIKNKLPH